MDNSNRVLLSKDTKGNLEDLDLHPNAVLTLKQN